ncbi:hypothetical protein BofuT4_uP035930.1 [Botrytis cinerea T4]|uniref:Uncharacterized protein n=1 Tax=Botryotinia fuckeliana (strain T4) TaxID=999810 RepID=G2Y4M3_BOTF4|nr:hypothetical protein BofuT4_uP035930.1 [Botrytis cinerea T4]
MAKCKGEKKVRSQVLQLRPNQPTGDETRIVVIVVIVVVVVVASFVCISS